MDECSMPLQIIHVPYCLMADVTCNIFMAGFNMHIKLILGSTFLTTDVAEESLTSVDQSFVTLQALFTFDCHSACITFVNLIWALMRIYINVFTTSADFSMSTTFDAMYLDHVKFKTMGTKEEFTTSFTIRPWKTT